MLGNLIAKGIVHLLLLLPQDHLRHPFHAHGSPLRPIWMMFLISLQFLIEQILPSPMKFLTTRLFRFHPLPPFPSLPSLPDHPSGHVQMSIPSARPLECHLRHLLHKPVLACVVFFQEMRRRMRRTTLSWLPVNAQDFMLLSAILLTQLWKVRSTRSHLRLRLLPCRLLRPRLHVLYGRIRPTTTYGSVTTEGFPALHLPILLPLLPLHHLHHHRLPPLRLPTRPRFLALLRIMAIVVAPHQVKQEQDIPRAGIIIVKATLGIVNSDDHLIVPQTGVISKINPLMRQGIPYPRAQQKPTGEQPRRHQHLQTVMLHILPIIQDLRLVCRHLVIQTPPASIIICHLNCHAPT